MRNARFLAISQRVVLIVALVIGTPLSVAGVDSWKDIYQEFRVITGAPPVEAWATNFSRALALEYPVWSSVTNVPPSRLRDALNNPPAGWRWGDTNHQERELRRAVEIEFEPGGGSISLMADTRDEWLFLDAVTPSRSFLGSSAEFNSMSSTARLIRVLYEIQTLEAFPWLGSGRVLQRNAQNVISGSSRLDIIPQLRTALSAPFAHSNFVRQGTSWTLTLVPTNAVRVSFAFDFIDRRTHDVVGIVSNLLVGDVWLMAGGPQMSLTSTNLPREGDKRGSFRVLIPEPQIAGTMQTSAPVRNNSWQVVRVGSGTTGEGPELAAHLVTNWLAHPQTEQVPLGFVLVGVGGTDLGPWCAEVGPKGDYCTVLSNKWLTSRRQFTNSPSNSVQFARGDLFRGTLSPLLIGPLSSISMTGVVWLHGEWTASQVPDSETANLRTRYHDDLATLITLWNGVTHNPRQVLVGQTSRPLYVRPRAVVANDAWTQIQLAQIDVAKKIGVRLIPLANLAPIHLRPTNLVTLAQRVFPFMLNTTFAAPEPPTMSLDGPTKEVVLTFASTLVTNKVGWFEIEYADGAKLAQSHLSSIPFATNNQFALRIPLKEQWIQFRTLRHLGGLEGEARDDQGMRHQLPVPTFELNK